MIWWWLTLLGHWDLWDLWDLSVRRLGTEALPLSGRRRLAIGRAVGPAPEIWRRCQRHAASHMGHHGLGKNCLGLAFHGFFMVFQHGKLEG